MVNNKYAKLVDGMIIHPEINKGNIINYGFNVKMLLDDGWKPYKKETKLNDGNKYEERHIERKNDIETIYIEIPKSINEAKADKLAEINQRYEEEAAMVKIDTPDSEIQTWPNQQKDFEAYSENPDNPTPFLDVLANARGIDRVELINKVGVKVNTFKTFMATLTGKRQRYEDMINAAQTVEEVEAVIWENG